VNSRLIKLFDKALEKRLAGARSTRGTERKGRSLLRLAVSKASSRREVVSATAPISARPCDPSAAKVALCRYAGRGLQPGNILLYSRLVVCEVSFLARNACSGDKAIGARRTARHCLAISLRSHSLGRDEQNQKQG
jgi:hypothetical protein